MRPTATNHHTRAPIPGALAGAVAGLVAGAALVQLAAADRLDAGFGHPALVLAAAGTLAFLGLMAAVAAPRFAQGLGVAATATATGAAVVANGSEPRYAMPLVALAAAGLGVTVAATVFRAGVPLHPGTLLGAVIGGGVGAGAVWAAEGARLGDALPSPERTVLLALAVAAGGTFAALLLPRCLVATGFLAGAGCAIGALVARTGGGEPGYTWALIAHSGAWLAVAVAAHTLTRRPVVAIGRLRSRPVVLSPHDWQATP